MVLLSLRVERPHKPHAFGLDLRKRYRPLHLLLFLFCLSFSHQMFAQQEQIIVSSEANPYAIAGKPIQATITVTHNSGEEVDPKTFTLEGKPIEATFVKQVTFSKHSNLVLSVYHFTLAPKKEGLHFLPPVSVTVGGKAYSSDESTYQVQKQ